MYKLSFMLLSLGIGKLRRASLIEMVRDRWRGECECRLGSTLSGICFIGDSIGWTELTGGSHMPLLGQAIPDLSRITMVG